MLLDSVGQCCTGSGLFFFSRGFLLILIGLCWPGSAGQRTSFSLVTSLVIPKASFHCINRFTPRERRNSQDSAFISLWSIDSFHPSSTTHTGIRHEGTCRADSCIAKTLGHWAGLTGTVRLLHPAKREGKVHSCTFDSFARPFGNPDTTALGSQAPATKKTEPIIGLEILRLEFLEIDWRQREGGRARSAAFLFAIQVPANQLPIIAACPSRRPFGSFIPPRPVLIAVLTLFNHHKPLQTESEVRPTGLPGPDSPITTIITTAGLGSH